jgi:tRNA A37 methylthiotransferase MiaB
VETVQIVPAPGEGSPVAATPVRSGAPRRVFLETYGCQMNVADSELVSSILRGDGYALTSDPGSADVLLVNTCAIRENAEERVLGRLSELLRHKSARPGVQLGLLGCVAIVPLAWTTASPAGPIQDEAFERIAALISVSYGSSGITRYGRSA